MVPDQRLEGGECLHHDKHLQVGETDGQPACNQSQSFQVLSKKSWLSTTYIKMVVVAYHLNILASNVMAPLFHMWDGM